MAVAGLLNHFYVVSFNVWFQALAAAHSSQRERESSSEWAGGAACPCMATGTVVVSRWIVSWYALVWKL